VVVLGVVVVRSCGLAGAVVSVVVVLVVVIGGGELAHPAIEPRLRASVPQAINRVNFVSAVI
jgi:hypothetical protein